MSSSSSRPRLTRDLICTTALRIADSEGLDGLTMRSLSKALGVQPMSLYHHVANKEAVLDAITDRVFAEIDLPDPSGEWRAEIAQRTHSARRALLRHPWAVPLMESRSHPGPHTLRHHDAVLGTLSAGGLGRERTALAYAMIDAFLYGFVLQESNLPFDTSDDGEAATGAPSAHEMASDMLPQFAEHYPHLATFTTDHVLRPGYNFGAQFGPGLELLLTALTSDRHH